MMTRTEQIQDILRSIRSASADIVGSAILTSDGFVIASMLPAEIDEEEISAMAATLLGAGERIASEVLSSELEQAFVRSSKGYMIVNALSEHEVLIILTNQRIKLGLVFLECRNRTEELQRLLGR